MNKYLFTVLFLVSTGINVFSQNWTRLQKLDHEAEYLIMSGLYKAAADNFIQILNELPGNSNIKFRIGYCYLNAEGYNLEAIPYLEKASANIALLPNSGSIKEYRSPTEALLFLGVAHQRALQFDLAEKAYSKFREILPDNDDRRKIADQHLKSIEHAKIFLKKPREVEKINLGKAINSNEANINAVVSGDGQTMAFTRISRRGFEVFVARKQGEKWGKPVNISRGLKMDFLLTTGISHDGSDIYLRYFLPDMSDIYTSTYENGGWSSAKKIGRPVSSKYDETHASVSSDGKTLYFTSNRPGGYGGLDIYRAHLNRRGRWRNVENMGPEINTFFNENTPFVTVDGKYLFFSSEGHNTMGGYDVFFAELENTENLYNLGYPVNDTYDNLFYFPFSEGRSGYISYHDKDGIGRRDLFLVSLNDLEMIDIDLASKHHLDKETLAKIHTESEADTLEFYILEGLADYDYEWEMLADPEFSHEEHDSFEESGFEEIPAHSKAGKSYSVQILALEEVFTSGLIDTIPGVIIHYDNDGFSRFLTGYYRTISEAMTVLTHYRENGYPDAFIRINNFIPNYTVQVKAMRNFLERSYFSNIEELICRKGTDGLYRYSWLYYTTWHEAASHLNKFKEMGYEDVFVNKLNW